MWKDAVRPAKGGTSLLIEVVPGSGRDAVTGYDEWRGRVKVAVTAQAKDGEANEAVVELFSDVLGVPETDVRISAGHKSRQKTLLVSGIGASEVIKRLEAVLGPG